jgi:hypothetical protein
VHQFGSDRAIDAAADGTDDPTGFAADFPDASNFLPYKPFLRDDIVVSSHPKYTSQYV